MPACDCEQLVPFGFIANDNRHWVLQWYELVSWSFQAAITQYQSLIHYKQQTCISYDSGE